MKFHTRFQDFAIHLPDTRNLTPETLMKLSYHPIYQLRNFLYF
jgi:hypothetical protein